MNKKKLKKLDDIEFDFNFDFIKIDAEGSEFEILKGAEKSIKKSLDLKLNNSLLKDLKILHHIKLFQSILIN